MRLSVADAICYAAMVGLGEAFFVADAVRLGAGPVALGLVVALPLCLGAAGPLVALALLSRVRRRKWIVAASAAGQAGVLGALATCDATGRSTPALLIALASAYQMFGQSAGAVWSSWYGDLVPARVRGRYFSVRARAAHLATFASVAGSGALLQWIEPGAAGDVAAGAGGTGFATIFALAATCRALSCALLCLSYEPAMSPMPSAGATVAELRGPTGRTLRRLIAIVFATQLAVYLSSPYFAPFMLGDLRLSYLEYTAGTLCVVGAKLLTLAAWGRVIDRVGARPAYQLAVVLIALVPVPWLFATGLPVVLAAQALSGFSWGGHEVSHFSLVLESAHARIRPQLFAALNVASGTAQLLGGAVGGVVLAAVDGRYRLVFAVSVVARLSVAAAVPWLLPAMSADGRVRRRAVLMRVIGLRPSGGVVHRPLPLRDDDGDLAE